MLQSLFVYRAAEERYAEREKKEKRKLLVSGI
jgi:hypothetical protein